MAFYKDTLNEGVKMNNFIKIMMLTIGVFSAIPALASTPAEELGTCLVDSLNGKERKILLSGYSFQLAHIQKLNLSQRQQRKIYKKVISLLVS